MGEKDTDVILGLDFDTSDAVKRAENLGDELDKAINKNKNSKDSKVLKLTDELGQCREKAQNLMDELSRIEEETKVPTEEYKQLTDSLTSSKERMDELVNSARNVRTEINNVKKASEELEGKDVSLGTTKMREELERVESQMVRVNNNMSDFERAGQTESDAYQKLVLKAAELEQRQQAYVDSLSRGSGIIKGEYTEEYSKLTTKLLDLMSTEQDIKEEQRSITEEVGNTVNQMRELQDSGEAFNYTAAEQSEEWQRANQELRDVNNKAVVLLAKNKEITKETHKQPPIISRIGNTLKSIVAIIPQIANGVGRIASKAATIAGNIKNAIVKWAQHRKEIDRNSNSMSGLVKKFLQYALGISGFMVAFNKLRSGISAGLSNLILFNDGLNTTNNAVSRLQSSILYLKNALGAMVSPIISLVTPALEMMIDRIAKLSNTIAAVMGSLTGKKSVTVAKKTSINAAESSSAGKAASDAEAKAQERYEKAKKNAEEKYQKEMASVAEKRAKAQAKAEERQAKAADKLAKAQEKANKALGNYDKLNVIATESADELEDIMADTYEDPVMEEINPEDYFGDLDGSSIGAGVADMFEDVPIDSILSDTIKDWIDKLKKAWTSGDWEGVGAIIADGLNKGMQRVDDWINNTFRPMGVKWAEIVARVLNGLVDGLNWSLLGQTIADGLNGIADIINKFLTTFDFYKLGSGIGTAIKSWFDTIDWDLMGQTFANKWNALINIIYGIVTTEGLWESIGNSIATFVNSWFDTIDWDRLADTIIAGVNGIGTAAKTAIEKIKWEEIGTTLGEKAKKILDGIKWEEAGSTIAGGINGVVTTLKNFVSTEGLWESLGTAIADSIKGLFENIKWEDVVTTLTTGFNGLVTSVHTIITNLDFGDAGVEFGDRIKQFIENIDWTAVGETISDFFSGALDFLLGIDWVTLGTDIANAIKNLFDGINWKELIVKVGLLLIELVMGAINLLGESIADFVDVLGSFFDSIGLDSIGGFFHGLSEGMKGSFEWIREHIFKPITDGIKSLFGIHSPSTVFAGFGKNLIEGLKNGLKQKWSDITSFFTEKISNLKENISGKFEKFKSNGEKLIKNINSGFKERWGTDISSFMTEKFNTLKDNLSSKAEKFNTVGKNIVSGLREGIRQKWDDFKTWVTDKFDSVRTAAERVYDENSPSKVFKQIGQYVTEGLAIGIEDSGKEAEDAIKDVAGNLINTMDDADTLLDFNMADNEAITALDAVIDKLQTMTSVFETMSNVIANIGDTQLTIPDIAVGKIIPTNIAMQNAGGQNKDGSRVEELLEELIKKLDENQDKDMPPVQLQVGRRTLAEIVWDETEKRYRQTGYAGA